MDRWTQRLSPGLRDNNTILYFIPFFLQNFIAISFGRLRKLTQLPLSPSRLILNLNNISKLSAQHHTGLQYLQPTQRDAWQWFNLRKNPSSIPVVMNNIDQVAPPHRTLCSPPPPKKRGKNECSQPNEKDDTITQIKGIFSSSCRRKSRRRAQRRFFVRHHKTFFVLFKFQSKMMIKNKFSKLKSRVRIFFLHSLSQRASLIQPEDLLFSG